MAYNHKTGTIDVAYYCHGVHGLQTCHRFHYCSSHPSEDDSFEIFVSDCDPAIKNSDPGVDGKYSEDLKLSWNFSQNYD